ncbi:hypothetical protein DUNSADRAFT_13267 [Dunaliella salina]|uniref:Encoded protein n=1 Tax=Dunaliella salina TaxID=3046 RepID=A0ABQ7G9T0_DUNSA|nr:hypothetical protein DUNSADRAFT_13267 [Dunaliella salina]|eukprot:KAF5831360.1 hypothetical protein DUNSADRAFT_13267 [Dunaliella salina]
MTVNHGCTLIRRLPCLTCFQDACLCVVNGSEAAHGSSSERGRMFKTDVAVGDTGERCRRHSCVGEGSAWSSCCAKNSAFHGQRVGVCVCLKLHECAERMCACRCAMHALLPGY